MKKAMRRCMSRMGATPKTEEFLMVGKVLLLLLVTITMAGTSAVASGQSENTKGREIIILKMAELELPFKHWKHQRYLNNECFHCHHSTLGKIDGWGDQTAHRICIECHELEKRGPSSCRHCHPNNKKKRK